MNTLREINLTQYVAMPDTRVADRIQELRNWLTKDYTMMMGHIEMCETLGIIPDYTRRAVAEQRYKAEQELRTLQKQAKLPRYRTFVEL